MRPMTLSAVPSRASIRSRNVSTTTVRATSRFEVEGRRLRKDRTRFWAHVVIGALRDDRGNLFGFAKIPRLHRAPART